MTRLHRQQSHFLPLVILDSLWINSSFLLAYFIRYELAIPYPVDTAYDSPFTPYIPFALLLTALCLLSYQIDGLYDRRRRRWLDQLYRLTSGTMTSIVLVMAITFVLQPLVYSRGMLVLTAALIVISLGGTRVALSVIEAARRRRGIGVEKVLVIGAGDSGRSVMQAILADPASGYKIAGYLDDDPAKQKDGMGSIRALGSLEQLPEVLAAEAIGEVIVTLPWVYHGKIMQIVELCERRDLRVRVVPDVFQQRMTQIDIDSLSGIPLLEMGPTSFSPATRVLKRLIDLILTLLALPLFVFLYVVVGALIRLDSPGPILYAHRRVGKDGKDLTVYKFRTMHEGADQMLEALKEQNEADGPLFKIRDDPRVTRVGKWLRKTSLDELAQIINVMRGEMSWVGPRPGTPEEVACYQPWQMKRTSVLPGVTGLWQVSGRSDVSFVEMCLLDIFYIENWSLELELRIILQTVPNILIGRGAY